MKSVAALTIGALMILSAPAFSQVPLTTATCTNSNLNAGILGKKIVGNQAVFVRRLATVNNPAMDDYGNTAPDDALELFCVSSGEGDPLGVLAACLSNENCPWR